MTLDKERAEKNLQEFMQKEGKEGFIKLLLKNYLYELVMYYLHSGRNKPVVKEDTGYQFYVDGNGQAYRPDQIEQFKKDLESECLRKANEIIAETKRLQIFDQIDKDFLVPNSKTAKLVREAFESIIKPKEEET